MANEELFFKVKQNLRDLPLDLAVDACIDAAIEITADRTKSYETISVQVDEIKEALKKRIHDAQPIYG